MQVLDINRVPTHVFHLKQSTARPTSTLALVIPGSPGMGHFYVPFATRLFQLGEGTYDVAVVSHAGHSPGFIRPQPQQFTDHQHSEVSLDADPLRTVEATENGAGNASNAFVRNSTSSIARTTVTEEHAETSPHRDWYNLEEQIAHKLAFLEGHAPHVQTLYLIGHSIGSWMVLQMIKRLDPSKVVKTVLLFPTIEHMGVTPKGVKLSPLFTTWRVPFTFFVWCLSWIPDFLKRLIVKQNFYTTPTEQVEHMVQGAINIDSKAMHNILCMADQEMQEVRDPPLDVIDDNIDKLVFYYGVDDKWNLDDCHSNMVERYPDKEVHLCDKGCDHAFVERSSNEMAEFVFSKLHVK